ncbi:uroporphyrinogen-III C-methyltransferase [Acuticoccus sediminis]|uniref:Uroporphyrinogen-III C-methyltransferase n=1 Tax=Acuticoccus sediminis TaxID=2184697 RepID=A0A8B2NZ95_9HYPH|nr:siroheme synthase CysG [Acuticoccus sediminis]RAI04151.1 uroporphyrinogen-III C-methyltransferase [Acuticoccus sediminis]
MKQHDSSRQPAEAQPQRLGELAVLPVFLGLKGRRAVLAGGTEAAAWKAEVLAAAGADVHIFAADPSEDMLSLIARGAADGSLTLEPRTWTRADFDDAAIAVCDAQDDAEAEAFYNAAREAGVPVNIVDKPAFCQFQFGSIVNRSPVVVGISTDGAAPIVGQAVRRRVETLLPPGLAAWGKLAAKVRARVMERLEMGRPRRVFWERFADHAFGDAAPPEDVDDLIDAASTESMAGRVTLVGAGPGDAELMTLKALRALQACDVILFDDLVSDDVLELARREAKRICVGKRGGRVSCKQEDITALMIRLARQGRSVVRLKSGDPMIFGRAGEEIAAVRAAGIEVSVVPGVTAASAMASILQTSLTHRDHAQTVSFTTGHSRHGKLPDGLDVATIVGEGRTAVVYMGGRTSEAFVDRARAAGVPDDTPAVAMWNVARPNQRVWRGRLANLPAAVQEANDDGPLLIAIGGVFGAEADVADMPAIVQEAIAAR